MAKELYFVRWNEGDPFAAAALGVGRTPKEVFDVVDKKYAWLSPSKAVKAMTNGAVNVVIIPAPPSDEGEKRVWAWFNLLMTSDAASWMSLGPYTGKEIMELTNTWAESRAGQYPVKIKVGDGPEQVLGPGNNQYDLATGMAKRAWDDLVATALEYFSRIDRIEGEK
jgi:hypothetical protein